MIKSMKKQLETLAFVAIGAALLSGCQTQQTAAPVQTTRIKCTIPKFEALPETKESQDKGGLTIGIVPVLYQSARTDATTVRQIQPTFAEKLTLITEPNLQSKVFVEQVTKPKLDAQPKRFEFTVRVNNKLDRVFRGQGSVVQFNIAGKLIPFGNTDYKEFINGIVPPRNETSFTIRGPLLDSGIPDKGTIGIFLYDVVTATDVAGNTTEKQNYEWYYNYSMQEVQESVEIKKTRGLMDISDYQRIMMQQQARAGEIQ